MAQTIKLRRSSTASAVPTTTQLALGEIAINTNDGKLYFEKDDGSPSIVEVANVGHVHVFRIGHTFGVSDTIKVATGDRDYIVPFFISLAAGQTATIVKARHRINSGTSANVKLTKNGTDLTGYTNITVNTTASDTTSSQALADNDLIALVVNSVTGTPKSISFTVFVEYSN